MAPDLGASLGRSPQLGVGTDEVPETLPVQVREVSISGVEWYCQLELILARLGVGPT
jgi:hypothetical protein